MSGTAVRLAVVLSLFVSSLAWSSAAKTGAQTEAQTESQIETDTASPVLPLLAGRFVVSVTWELPSGASGHGTALALSNVSGSCWLFDSDNIEITAKILNGTALNGHYWVFLASMTDVAYTVTVVDRGSLACLGSVPACPEKTYANPAGKNQNFLDVEAFTEATPFSVPTVGDLLTVSPRLPTSADRIDLHVNVTPACLQGDQPAQVLGNTIRYNVTTFPVCPPFPFPPTQSVGQVGPLPAGLYSVVVSVDGVPQPSAELRVTDPTTSLHVQEGLDLNLDWQLGGGSGGGSASAVALSEESGYFWFFNAENVEVTAKVLDGRSINGHFWLFAASMTDVAHTLTVTDHRDPACAARPAGCPRKTYTTLAGRNVNLIDLNLF
ncbi:MAG TPA: hypothetical protein VMM92_15750 [Thermoanaerobaculia bacterium]|nr:hypothetical protein [Thermoanaerobaculia bacterium]